MAGSESRMALVESSIDDFVAKYPKYSTEIIAVFRILVDQQAKKELTSIEIIDGCEFGREGYMLIGSIEKSSGGRICVPISMNDRIDMAW